MDLSLCLAYAKRIPASKVEPAIHEGVRYTAPNDNGGRADIQRLRPTLTKRLCLANS